MLKTNILLIIFKFNITIFAFTNAVRLKSLSTIDNYPTLQNIKIITLFIY